MLHALKTSWLRRQKRSEGSVEGETTPSPDSTGAVRPQPYVVSFKLETDEAEMRVKSVKNLHKYQSDAVVGNLLHNYREKVWIYTHDGDDHHPLCVEKSPGKTIESYLCDFFIAKALEN
ncbi:unnamed protein product [Phytomonas sp. EM1]|nr:unnamed protein product [Phytomonas sp. EM1]|eukprot:CCW64342.1 unnamed protein product [Phytomonas sp. isolate EM1]